MSRNKPSICIVLLIGIPASGKSYFRQYFYQLFESDNKTCIDLVSNKLLTNVYVVPVSYDNFIDDQDVNDEKSNNWKSKRMEICNSVDNVINMVKRNDCQSDERILLDGIFNKEIALKSDCVFFIIDDNMYYQSMRYEYYKVARKYNTGFCQFYLKATLKDALHYNSLRNNTIPENTIRKMFIKLEPPNINNKWEKYSLAIDSFTNFKDTSLLHSVINVVLESLKNPAVLVTDLQNKKEAQEITKSNVIHQIDLILRNLVSEKIKEASSGNQSIGSIKEVSQLYCGKRQEVLQKIKMGEIMLPFPNAIVQKIAPDNLQVVKEFLLQHLNS